MSATEELFAQYRPVAKRIAQGFMRKLPCNVLYEDVEAAAFLGLWQAVNANPDREGFEWYLRVRVRGAVLDELRAQDWLKRRAREIAVERGEVLPGITRFDELSFADHGLLVTQEIPADEQVEARDRCLDLERSFGELPPRLELVLRRLLSGTKQREIATELGVSVPRVSQLHAQALGLLKKNTPRPRVRFRRVARVVRDDVGMLGALWEGLCQGNWRIIGMQSSAESFWLEARRSHHPPLRPHFRAMLEHWLRSGHAKMTVAEFRTSRTRLMGVLSASLDAIGAPRFTRRVPLIVTLAAQAPRAGHLGRLASPCRLEFSVNPVALARLPAAQLAVARYLLDGVDRDEISALRGTSRQTINNQTHDIFRRFGVSGANEFRAVVARTLLDLARQTPDESP